MGGYQTKRRRALRRCRRACLQRQANEAGIGKQNRRLRCVCVALLMFEFFVGAGRMMKATGDELRLFWRETECAAEWISPGEERENEEVYGVRLRLDKLELKFYHRSLETVLK